MGIISRKLRKRQSNGKHPKKKTYTRHRYRTLRTPRTPRTPRSPRTPRTRRSTEATGFFRNFFKKINRRTRRYSPRLKLNKKGYVVNEQGKQLPLDGYSPPHKLNEKGEIIVSR